MSDTSTTSTKEAQVIAAGVSYFTEDKVIGASGNARKDANGNEISIEVRHEAVLGDVVDLSEHEYERLLALGAIREPSTAPLRPTTPIATPFGVPVVDEETGLASAFAGPVMGDPRPAGPDVDPLELSRGRPRGLTPEEAAVLQRVANGEIDLNGDPVDGDGLGDDPDAHHVGSEAEQPNAGGTRNAVEGSTTVVRPPGNSLNADGDGEGEPIEADYDEQSKDKLLAEVERRNADRPEDEKIVVEGTGSNGNVVKDDVVAALEEDDDR